MIGSLGGAIVDKQGGRSYPGSAGMIGSYQNAYIGGYGKLGGAGDNYYSYAPSNRLPQDPTDPQQLPVPPIENVPVPVPTVPHSKEAGIWGKLLAFFDVPVLQNVPSLPDGPRSPTGDPDTPIGRDPFPSDPTDGGGTGPIFIPVDVPTTTPTTPATPSTPADPATTVTIPGPTQIIDLIRGLLPGSVASPRPNNQPLLVYTPGQPAAAGSSFKLTPGLVIVLVVLGVGGLIAYKRFA